MCVCERCEQRGVVVEWWEQRGAVVGACEGCEQHGVVVEWWEQRGAA